MPDSFYEPDGDLFVSTELTRGPWDPSAQHAGPPAALIGREVERLGGDHLRGAALGADRSAPRRGPDRASRQAGRDVRGDPQRRGGRGADAGAGLALAHRGGALPAALDWSKHPFINVDLSVHLHRMPEGEWVCLDAITLPERNGVGMADTRLLDERGPIGRATQTLLVAERS